MESRKKKIILAIIGLSLLLLALVGVSYSFFNYSRAGTANTITLGRVSFNHTQSTLVNLSNAYPIDVSGGVPNNNSNVGTFVINIVGDTDSEEGIEYLVSTYDYIAETSTSREVPISVDITVSSLGTESNNYFDVRENTNVSIYKKLNDTVTGDKDIFVGLIAQNPTLGTATGVNGSITIKAYLDAYKIEVVNDDYNEEIPDKEVFTFTEWNSLQTNGLSFKIKVEAQEGIWVERGVDKVRKAIAAKINAETNSCNPIWVDDMGTSNDESDDITYFSGTNSCVDMNYVWYSGKLWRITAIYPDGAMKLVTQNGITSIAFGATSSDVNFYTNANTTSYMYQWLNEDFYNTLYYANVFIDKTKEWNATNSNSSAISTRLSETTMVSANVGLLNSYDYYNSFRCIGSDSCSGTTFNTGYLNNRYYWYLLNPFNTSGVWIVATTGESGPMSATPTVRPSIVIKSSVEFTGSGTSDNPFKIVGDKNTGNTNELINTRLSGEYVKLVNNDNNQTFRIIGVEESKTKVIAMDYAENHNSRKFASNNADTLWGSGTTTDTNTWYTYLNSTYLPNLVNTYGDIFTNGAYYLETSVNSNYKTVKVSSSTFDIGLPHYGEMFATQQAGGSSSSYDIWLMNRGTSTTNIWYVEDSGRGYAASSTSYKRCRPTIYLKSTVKILSGSGTESDPYVVGL